MLDRHLYFDLSVDYTCSLPLRKVQQIRINFLIYDVRVENTGSPATFASSCDLSLSLSLSLSLFLSLSFSLSLSLSLSLTLARSLCTIKTSNFVRFALEFVGFFNAWRL
jgi:hypothetical protein